MNKISKTRGSLYRDHTIAAWIMLAPTVIGMVIFTFGAMVYSFYLGFTNYSLINIPKFIGFANYGRVLTSDIFQKSLVNVTYYVILSIPTSIAMALLIAMLMNMKIKGITLFRTIYFTPAVASTVVVAMIWGTVLNYRYGILNRLLSLIGVAPVDWLNTPQWTMPALALVAIWSGIGGNIIIYLAGLKGIPRTLYEAAIIDGAGSWAAFRHITIPMMTPTIFFSLTLGLIGGFQLFELPYVLTKGGPQYATITPVYQIYESGFTYFEMGRASAMAWIVFAVILVVTAINLRLSNRWVFYAGR